MVTIIHSSLADNDDGMLMMIRDDAHVSDSLAFQFALFPRLQRSVVQ